MEGMTCRPVRSARFASTLTLVVAVAVVGCAQEPDAPGTPTGSPSGTPSTSSPTTAPPTTANPTTPTSSPTASAAPTASGTLSSSPTATAQPLACPASTGESLKRAPGQGKTVALTFDDGPGPQTLQVADALDAAGVHATFFVTGQHASANPAVVKELARRGHLIAGHSWDHRYPKAVKGGWTTSFVTDQINRTDAELQKSTSRPTCFFRPPGGFLDGVPAAARRTGATVVMWSIDSLDWKQPGSTTQAATDAIVTHATRTEGQSHPIVLFHDAKASGEPDSKVSPNRSNTVAALPAAIDWYQKNGYTFVRLDGQR